MKKTVVSLLLALLLAPLSADAQDYVPSPENLKAREEFAAKRFGIFIHWGIYSMRGRGEWALQVDSLRNDEYRRMAAGFYPSKFNAEQWLDVFKRSGAKYICFTSRHHDSFSMFDTKASDYSIMRESPFMRDVVAELAQACRNHDMTFNLYYSILDWAREDYWPRGRTGGATGRADGDAQSWGRYHDFMDAQLTELLTNYGPIGAIWLDGLWDMDIYPVEKQPEIWQLKRHYDLIHKLQPACLVGNNHHLLPFAGEDIQIFERDIPGYNEGGLSGQEISRLPLETCQTMNWSWGYRMDDIWYKPARDFIQYLVRTAGKGANLLLNVGPRADGTLMEEAVDRLLAMGSWLERNGETIYGTDGGYIAEQLWGVSTQKGNVLYIHVLNPAQQIEIDLPAGNKVLSVKAFADSARIPYKAGKSSLAIQLPQIPQECEDYIIRVEFKKSL